jgi:hypothetical protein
MATAPAALNSVVPGSPRTAYTKSLDSSGWLRIKLEPSGAEGYLCDFVKVSIIKEDARTYFTILEGFLAGKMASLSKLNAGKCLGNATRGSGANVTVTMGRREWWVSKPRRNEGKNQLSAKLAFNGLNATITLDSDVDYRESNPLSPNYNRTVHSKPLPRGTYHIMVPEIPKDASMTGFYASGPDGYPNLQHHTVWFPIEYAATHNSSFIHVGNLSEGCVTIYELRMWNPLYSYLISNRLDTKGKYVGRITIA